MQSYVIFESVERQRSVMLGKIDSVLRGQTGGLFGYRIDPLHPTAKQLQFHNGLDIPLPVGTPFYLPYSAKIVAKWNDKGQFPQYPYGLNGNAIRVELISSELLDIFQISMAHLDRWGNVEIGKEYPAKTIFAYSGNTGASTGPHVHLCFWKKVDGVLKTVDPFPYMSGGVVGIAEIPFRESVLG